MSRSQLAERIARHGFSGRPAATVAEAAGLVCGLQAQDTAAARLGVRARALGLTEADVTWALDVDRTVVRTWLMRSTIHLVPARDVRWMTALLGPMIQRRFGTRRWPELGLTSDLLSRAEQLTPEVLADGPLTRHELVAALASRGLAVEATGQAPTHLPLYLSTIGLLCRGADRGRESTFALIDSWLPGTPAGPRGDDALAELARRFFRAFSPATPADFTTWSGLPSSRAVRLIRDELTPAEVGGRAGFRFGDAVAGRGLRLLPAFDNYLIGYRERADMIENDRYGEVYVGGIIRPTVLLDGVVIGRWRLERAAEAARLEVVGFRSFSRSERAAIDAEAVDIGRFVDLPVTLVFG